MPQVSIRGGEKSCACQSAMDSGTTWHEGARSGTAWHNLAQPRGGEIGPETWSTLQGLLRFRFVGGWQRVVLARAR